MSEDTTDFYEDDEPAEYIHAAFDRSEKALTAAPSALQPSVHVRTSISQVTIESGTHGVLLGVGQAKMSDNHLAEAGLLSKQ